MYICALFPFVFMTVYFVVELVHFLPLYVQLLQSLRHMSNGPYHLTFMEVLYVSPSQTFFTHEAKIFFFFIFSNPGIHNLYVACIANRLFGSQ